MRLLLDTHTLLWAMSGSPHLSNEARSSIANVQNEVIVSVASVWEAAIKHHQGKLPEAAPLLNDPVTVLARMGFISLAVQLDHARLSGSLISQHKDPFDRMLAAQATLEALTLVSRDTVFDHMLVPRLW